MKTNQFLKLFIYLSFVLLGSCRTDVVQDKNIANLNYKKSYYIKLKTLPEAKTLLQGVRNINLDRLRNTAKISEKFADSLCIDTKIVKYLETSNYKSYTFSVKSNSNKFYNLAFSTKDDKNFHKTLVEYNFTESDWESYFDRKRIVDIEKKIKLYNIEENPNQRTVSGYDSITNTCWSITIDDEGPSGVSVQTTNQGQTYDGTLSSTKNSGIHIEIIYNCTGSDGGSSGADPNFGVDSGGTSLNSGSSFGYMPYDLKPYIRINILLEQLNLPYLNTEQKTYLQNNPAIAENIYENFAKNYTNEGANFSLWSINFLISNTNSAGVSSISWEQFQNTFLSNQNIIDNLDGYTCAQDLLKQLPVLNNDLAKLINDTFGNNDKVNITFKAKNGMGDVDGERESVDRQNGMFNVIINLNSDVLKYATKEYILVTMYHEALHAYIGYQVTTLPYDQYLTNFPKVTEYEVKDANGNIIKKYTLDKDHKNFGSFIAFLQNAVTSYNSKIPTDVALSLAKWGIVTDISNDEIKKNNNEKDTRNQSDYKGTKCQ